MKSSNSIKKVISLAALIFTLSIQSNTAKAQTSRHKFGVGMSTTVGGCGYGTIYNPSAHYYYGPFKMELALSVQKRKFNFTGAQFTFEYSIFDGCNRKADKLCFEGTQVYLFTATNYNQGAYLGKSQIKTERRVADDHRAGDETGCRWRAAGLGGRICGDSIVAKLAVRSQSRRSVDVCRRRLVAGGRGVVGLLGSSPSRDKS